MAGQCCRYDLQCIRDQRIAVGNMKIDVTFWNIPLT